MVIRIRKYTKLTRTTYRPYPPIYGRPKVKKELEVKKYFQEYPKNELKLYLLRSKESTESWFLNGLGTFCINAMYLKAPLELVKHFDVIFW